MEAKLWHRLWWINETHDQVLISKILPMLIDSGFQVIQSMQHFFDPIGFSIIWLLAESHCAIHTFPESGKSAIEISSCNEEKFIVFENKMDNIDNNVILVTATSNVLDISNISELVCVPYCKNHPQCSECIETKTYINFNCKHYERKYKSSFVAEYHKNQKGLCVTCNHLVNKTCLVDSQILLFHLCKIQKMKFHTNLKRTDFEKNSIQYKYEQSVKRKEIESGEFQMESN